MALHKIKDFDPDYRKHFPEQQHILEYDLYSGSEKVGAVKDMLVDDDGKFRYLVIHTGGWFVGKDVLLPIGRAEIDNAKYCVHVSGLTRAQVEALPQYKEGMAIDYDHEEQVRGVYRPTTAALDNSAALEASSVQDRSVYDREPALYNLDDQKHQNLRLYEERLIASKTRQKTGEVAIGKHVETEVARVAVPIEKERVIVERNPVSSAAVAPGEATFQEGEVARVEVYEETPDVRKEAFVREEVRVRKEVDQENVQVEEQLRREELDVDTTGRPVVDKGIDKGTDSRPRSN